jgi:hypothetical protein
MLISMIYLPVQLKLKPFPGSDSSPSPKPPSSLLGVVGATDDASLLESEAGLVLSLLAELEASLLESDAGLVASLLAELEPSLLESEDGLVASLPDPSGDRDDESGDCELPSDEPSSLDGAVVASLFESDDGLVASLLAGLELSLIESDDGLVASDADGELGATDDGLSFPDIIVTVIST